MSSLVRTILPHGGGGESDDTASPLIATSFCAAMRSIAASVTIISARDEARAPHGMAASAVISVSMEPPSMLIAVNRSASIHPIVEETKLFCVNVLASGQTDIVSRFSRSELRDQRFASDDWERGFEGLPYLTSARCAVFCTTEAAISYGTHTLYVGRVSEVIAGVVGTPLLWFDGGQAEVHRRPA
jgi:flavin reductase (DIM6/NTAB) family NADH-FMN oxidoreductase RutF